MIPSVRPDGPPVCGPQVHIIKRGPDPRLPLVGNHYKEINPRDRSSRVRFRRSASYTGVERGRCPATNGLVPYLSAGPVGGRTRSGAMAVTGWLTEQDWTSTTGEIYAHHYRLGLVPNGHQSARVRSGARPLYIWYGIQETSGNRYYSGRFLQIRVFSRRRRQSLVCPITGFVFDGEENGRGRRSGRGSTGCSADRRCLCDPRSMAGGLLQLYVDVPRSFRRRPPMRDKPTCPNRRAVEGVGGFQSSETRPYFSPRDVNVRMTGITCVDGYRWSVCHDQLCFTDHLCSERAPATNIEQGGSGEQRFRQHRRRGSISISTCIGPLYNPPVEQLSEYFLLTRPLPGATSYQVAVTGDRRYDKLQPDDDLDRKTSCRRPFPNGNLLRHDHGKTTLRKTQNVLCYRKGGLPPSPVVGPGVETTAR
jgi:hypothetical protein